MASYLQIGIQTQWNSWDGAFYENSRRAILVNNFRKKIHLIFHLRSSEFDSDLKHSDKEYIYLQWIYCICGVVKAIYKWRWVYKFINETWWVCFFLPVSLFKLGQIQFWLSSTAMQQLDVFWKLLGKLLGKHCDGNHFWQSLSYSKWTPVRVSFYQFSKHFFIIASKHSRETHSFEW